MSVEIVFPDGDKLGMSEILPNNGIGTTLTDIVFDVPDAVKVGTGGSVTILIVIDD